jgi:muramoyltetrapeptide carboxypeptidase
VLIPQPLRHDSHLRIVSPGLPSLALVPERAHRADCALRAMGFRISYGAHAFSISEDGITVGSAAQRANDLMAAFEDDSVDAILVSDSGLGSRELLPLLDAAIIATHPKPFIGYCDTVFLHQYLASCAGLSSLYGCVMMVHFDEAAAPFPETLDHFQRALLRPGPLACHPVASRVGIPADWYRPESESRPRSRDVPGGWTWLRRGRARGPLIGGEISILPEVIECFSLRMDGAILFWDVEVHDKGPIREQLLTLCTSTSLAGLAGMIVGAHPRIPPRQWAAAVGALVHDLLPGTTFPILVNADLSHLCPCWIVPYGEDVIMDEPGSVTFPRTTIRPTADR